MKLRAVEELREDFGNLRFDDARTVVFDRDFEAILGELGDLDDDLRKDARFFASVERVVDGFLDGGEEGLRGIVETEKVTVLGEELRDRDLALLRAHRFGGGATAWLRFFGDGLGSWF